MKVSELNVTDLMVGDWVICYHPSRPQSFERVSIGLLHTIEQQEHGHIKEDSPLFRIVEPIPLTPKILKKNGFIRINAAVTTYKLTKSLYWTYRGLEHELSEIPICHLNFVHELQHILKLVKSDEEIIL